MSASSNQVTNLTNRRDFDYPAPELLRSPEVEPHAFPTEALGPMLSGVALQLAASVKAPAAIIGQSLLAAASLASQHLAHVEIDGRRELLSLWCLTVGQSGERKTGVDKWALAPHRDFEMNALADYDDQIEDHKIELEAYNRVSKAKTQKLKDRDAIEAALRSIGAPPSMPQKPLLLVRNPTLEGLHRQLATGRPSIGLFHDDAGEFLGGHSWSKENRLKTIGGLSSLWDSGEFDRMRVLDGAEKYRGKRLALHLMIQPALAKDILADELLLGQGFLARCLIIWPKSTMGERTYSAEDLATKPLMKKYGSAITALLRQQASCRAGSRNELETRPLKLTDEAKARWVEAYNKIEHELGDNRALSEIRPTACKAASQALRIAGVLTLVENPESTLIELPAISRALSLITYYLSEARRTMGEGPVAPKVKNAERLLKWIETGNYTLIYSELVLRLGPSCLRNIIAFNEAVKVLELTGAVRVVKRKPMPRINGRVRRRVWELVKVVDEVDPARR